MTNAFHYQHSFNDALAESFRTIMSLPSAFTLTLPNKIGGLSLWLEARQEVTVVRDANNKVSGWNAYYGAGMATQLTPALQPIYQPAAIHGNPAIRSIGGNRYMNLGRALGAVQTVCVVHHITDLPTGFSAPFGQHDWGNHRFYLRYWPGFINLAIGGSSYTVAITLSPNTTYLWTVSANGTHASLRQDGVEIISNAGYSFTGTSNCNAALFGRYDLDGSIAYPLKGDIGSFLCFDRALGVTELEQVEAYLKQVWAP